MEKRSVETILRHFNEAGVRYLVVGGMAVVAHGYVRFTADFDLMLDLENEENVRLALNALKNEGYAPRIPVSIEMFADGETRKNWHEQRNLLVFSLWSDRHAQTEIDIFVFNPLDFTAAFARSELKHSASGIAMRVVALPDLLHLKAEAGRPKDLLDIQYLQRLPQEEKP